MNRDSFVKLSNIPAQRRQEREIIMAQALTRKKELELKKARRQEIMDYIGFFCTMGCIIGLFCVLSLCF